MSTVRIALANVEFPATPEESIRLVEDAIAQASTAGADVICFPECFVPGYRCMGKHVAPPDAGFLERAWSLTAKAAAQDNIAVVLGTERVVSDGLRISVLVINRDGTIAGFQDKVQLDPGEEEHIYSPGAERRVFHNTCFFATVNCASRGSRTTSAIVRPDGTLLSYQPYGKRGVLIADLDLTQATGLLAKRHKPL
jgi:predicted amidohydrolase